MKVSTNVLTAWPQEAPSGLWWHACPLYHTLFQGRFVNHENHVLFQYEDGTLLNGLPLPDKDECFVQVPGTDYLQPTTLAARYRAIMTDPAPLQEDAASYEAAVPARERWLDDERDEAVIAGWPGAVVGRVVRLAEDGGTETLLAQVVWVELPPPDDDDEDEGGHGRFSDGYGDYRVEPVKGALP